jgi:hypothetical protein
MNGNKKCFPVLIQLPVRCPINLCVEQKVSDQREQHMLIRQARQGMEKIPLTGPSLSASFFPCFCLPPYFLFFVSFFNSYSCFLSRPFISFFFFLPLSFFVFLLFFFLYFFLFSSRYPFFLFRCVFLSSFLSSLLHCFFFLCSSLSLFIYFFVLCFVVSGVFIKNTTMKCSYNKRHRDQHFALCY